MDLLVAQNITKRYANHTALNNISIQVPNQSIFGLLGPNGAGKTSLIRIINQITAPDEGELFFDGRKMTAELTAQIGYLPEERGLYKKMKVGEQALYLAQLKGMSHKEALTKLKYWFERFEIGAWWNKKVEELSKGMQQKIQFIVTIVHRPKLLIFDEPFSGFDPINVNLLKEEILKLKDEGSTIIFSTHNMASVEELCDHIALINKSEKILEGKVRDIRHEYRANMWEVEYSDFASDIKSILPGNFQVLNSAPEEELVKSTIRMMNGSGPNDLLGHLLPHVQVHSFREVLPSMNDIFIQQVQEKNPESATL